MNTVHPHVRYFTSCAVKVAAEGAEEEEHRGMDGYPGEDNGKAPAR